MSRASTFLSNASTSHHIAVAAPPGVTLLLGAALGACIGCTSTPADAGDGGDRVDAHTISVDAGHSVDAHTITVDAGHLDDGGDHDGGDGDHDGGYHDGGELDDGGAPHADAAAPDDAGALDSGTVVCASDIGLSCEMDVECGAPYVCRLGHCMPGFRPACTDGSGCLSADYPRCIPFSESTSGFCYTDEEYACVCGDDPTRGELFECPE